MASFQKSETSPHSRGTNDGSQGNIQSKSLEADMYTYLRSVAADFLKVEDKRAWLNEMERFRQALSEVNREREYRFRFWHAAISPDLPDIIEICE